jgi:hypothetical protein
VIHGWSPFCDRLSKNITLNQRLLNVHYVSYLCAARSNTWNISWVSTEIKHVVPLVRTYVCVRIQSSYSTVEVIVSQSNVGWIINQSIVSQVLGIWIYLIVCHMSCLNDHVFYLFFRLRYQKVVENVVWLLGLHDSHYRFTISLNSFPFTPFTVIIRFMIMLFNFRLRLIKFIIFYFLLFSLFASLIALNLLVFLQNWF